MYFVQTAAPNVVDVYMTVNGTPVNATVANPNGVPQPLTFSNTGAVTAPVGGGLTFDGFTPPDGAQAMSMNFNFGQTTQYGGGFGVTSITQNGYATGQLSTVAIDSSGIVSAVYTNGRSTAARAVGHGELSQSAGLEAAGRHQLVGDLHLGQRGAGHGVLGGLRQHSVRRSGELERRLDHRARQHDHRAAFVRRQRAGHHDGQPRIADRHSDLALIPITIKERTMDRGLYVAMTGAKQIMQAQAVNNHNIANVSTTGFRADAVVVHQRAHLRSRVTRPA